MNPQYALVGRQVTEFRIEEDCFVLIFDYGISKIIIREAEIEYKPGPLELFAEFIKPSPSPIKEPPARAVPNLPKNSALHR